MNTWIVPVSEGRQPQEVDSHGVVGASDIGATTSVPDVQHNTTFVQASSNTKPAKHPNIYMCIYHHKLKGVHVDIAIIQCQRVEDPSRIVTPTLTLRGRYSIAEA
jgi:hypothetical protein